jgi:hypothetical protein
VLLSRQGGPEGRGRAQHSTAQQAVQSTTNGVRVVLGVVGKEVRSACVDHSSANTDAS